MTDKNATTTTAKKTAAKKAPRPKYNYPFKSKAEILALQKQDFGQCLAHLAQLYTAQTQDEQEAKSTKWRNKSGFMSSHAVVGTRLAEKVRAGESLSEEEQDQVRSIVARYGKQLARFAREADIAANPGLAAIAEIFSAD